MRKIFKWFFKPRQKGENKMSKNVEEQVKHLSSRIGDMSDKLASMESEISLFKKRVTEDMKTLVKLAQKK
tara:strand:- start:234 stop:443 length:210 start_codon:yes stop_codon:yes gene_type:complete